MEHATHTSALTDIRDVEEKLSGIARMVEEGRYCVDILAEIRAASTALKNLENVILAEHLEHCIQAAVDAGDESERAKKIAEVMGVMKRFP